MSLDNRLAFQKLDVYVVARELVRVVNGAKIRDGGLRDQATRASKSTFLAIAEGLPSPRIKMRKVYFERARCSLCESIAAMDVAEVIGAIDAGVLVEVARLAQRLEAMLVAMAR